MRLFKSNQHVRKSVGINALLMMAFISGLSLFTFAQARQSSSVIVTVSDQTGKVIPGAQTELRLNDKVISTAMTNDEGRAELKNVPPEKYLLIVTRDNFEPATQEITIATSAPIELPLTLVPKGVSASIDIAASASQIPATEQPPAKSVELQRADMKDAANRPRNVADSLPGTPGITRTDQGQLRIFGGSENRAALLVGGVDVTDPATGQFGLTVPVDSVENINIFRTPFLAQYGRFTAGVVAVETRRGGEKWNFELNDPFPEFRYLRSHIRGLRTATPRLTFNGPLIKDKLYFSQGIEYNLDKRRTLALSFPNNETVNESVNSFTQFDYIPGSTHALTGTLHITPRKSKFFNLDFFNQRPVTPTFSAQDYTGTITDRWTLGENLLESTVSAKRASIGVWPQGNLEMTLTPTGNAGNYFNKQDRDSSRVEWIEMLSLKPIRAFGTHNLKFGGGLTRTGNQGEYFARAINIRDTAGALLRRVEFNGGSRYDRNDTEAMAFGQNHWAITSRLAVDVGTRLERQAITETLRIAPRLGIAWTPFGNQETVVRTGYGLFYDRVPLNVYAFDRFPQQTVTTYGFNGIVTDGPRRFVNVIDKAEATTSPFIRRGSNAGNFAPYSATWTVEIEHPLTKFLRLRANYQAGNSQGLVILRPGVVQGQDAFVLSGAGRARYRQFEILTQLKIQENQRLYFSYVRSRSNGDLNEFNNYLGSFPIPVIRPNQYSNLPGDMPHRFLVWGTARLPWKMRIAPLVEWRTGFPYFNLDAAQQYVGVPNANSTRYPGFLSVDARVTRDFLINKPVESVFRYKLQDPTSVRVSFSVFNLTNHFNPTTLRNNIADPQYGLFFGQNKRRWRVDFDIIF